MALEIRSEEWDVADRLEDIGISKPELLDVVSSMVAAYFGCTDNDPRTAAGYEAYRTGVRRLREILRSKGEWEKSNSKNFETVVNPSTKIRIAVASTDDVTGMIIGDLAPENRNPKGVTAERAAEHNQITDQLTLPGSEQWKGADPTASPFQTWHLCTYIRGDDVRAELSRFNGYEAGYLTDCRERILIVRDGDWASTNVTAVDPGPDFSFEIKRKA